MGVGSSPRLRGTFNSYFKPCLHDRFIPAPAGNMSLSTPKSISSPVHPRACGEHQIGLQPLAATVGSSPRLRGTYSAGHVRPRGIRFIPAPAGNIRLDTKPPSHQAVHPRACGEHAGFNDPANFYDGSSPRLRGTYLCSRQCSRDIRFIPAPAGNISGRARRRAIASVHPRACGEHSWLSCLPYVVSGSSPRLRGTLGD